MGSVEILLALILLELERSNELAEIAGGQPPTGTARSKFTVQQVGDGVRDWLDG